MKHNGFTYWKVKTNKERTVQYWRCQYANQGCKARIHTNTIDEVVVGEVGVHDHNRQLGVDGYSAQIEAGTSGTSPNGGK
jgi:hypothetical protein